MIYFDKLLNNDVGCFLIVASKFEKVATYLTVTQIALSSGIIPLLDMKDIFFSTINLLKAPHAYSYNLRKSKIKIEVFNYRLKTPENVTKT